MISSLVRELAEINRHQISTASGGQMNVDLETGIVRTPVGVVTRANVDEARRLLDTIGPFVVANDFDNQKFVGLIQRYLTLVPQKVGAQRGWHRHFLDGDEALQRQSGLLDQLESSVSVVEDRIASARRDAGRSGVADIFDVSLRQTEDPGILAEIGEFYRRGRNRMHQAARALKMGRVFDLSLRSMDAAWETDGARVGGTMRLWHGTRAHNLISILRSGLVIADRGGSIHITGRMFGNGAYFSDQSTKSLNYSWGYWDGARDARCFMLIADVAMGRYWHPTRTGCGLVPPPGYDSIYARGGKDQVLNNEMIVFRTGQVRPRHLVEFTS